MGSVFVGVNGSEVWAYVVQTDDGFRMRFALDDWQKLSLDVSRRVPVRLSEKGDVWFFITHVTELPPIVWVTLAKRVQAER